MRATAAAILTALLACAAARAQVSPGPLARPHHDLEGNENCLKCHASKSTGQDERCLDCHKAIAQLKAQGRGFHARAGKGSCAKCHPDHAGVDFALIDWPKNGPPGFDHGGSTGFRLAGKHASIACRDCHQAKYRATKERVKKDGWVGLSPACASCHADPHKGALGTDCARCHRPTAWKDVSAFDHGRTAYPLTGKHATVRCAACHRPAGAKETILKPLPHAECSDCHRDPHAGRLGPKCSRCHGTAGFKKVAAGSFDHDRTRYPLRGAHRAVACASCHVPGRADRERPAFGRCENCHADPHAGQGTLAGKPVDCAACHDVSGFKTSTFTAARHAATPFPLDGKHAAAKCAACHRPAAPDRAKLGKAGILMRPRHDACASCHADPHGGQLASRPDKGACDACHTTATFKPSRVGPAQHAKLKLPLDGAHAKVACAACHGAARKDLPAPPGAARAGKAGFVFAGIETDCAACHRDPHGFADRACARCHTTATFSPSTIGPEAHARFAFRLEGAHGAVPCVACHRELERRSERHGTLLRSRDPMPKLPFKDPRRACAECHTGPHGTQFASRPDKGRCDACHGLDGFRPASKFDHDRDSRFALGKAHAKVACARCHVSRPGPDGKPFVVYRGTESRCAGCHRPKSASGGAS